VGCRHEGEPLGLGKGAAFSASQLGQPLKGKEATAHWTMAGPIALIFDLSPLHLAFTMTCPMGPGNPFNFLEKYQKKLKIS